MQKKPVLDFFQNRLADGKIPYFLITFVSYGKASRPVLVELGIVTLVSELQSSNADSPIALTLFGMVTLVSDEQPANANSPISVTLLGMVTLLSDEQP